MKNQFAENTSHVRFIPDVFMEHACGHHSAPKGLPCWTIPANTGIKWGVCNARAVKAGFNSPISQQSLRSKPKPGPRGPAPIRKKPNTLRSRTKVA